MIYTSFEVYRIKILFYIQGGQKVRNIDAGAFRTKSTNKRLQKISYFFHSAYESSLNTVFVHNYFKHNFSIFWIKTMFSIN